ncbi:hypothetical protein J7J90_03390 [Candidatus Micrarchaeota archaeon]|nr:hypothetical protein [Candidatus Micrarchaeota archaeon]
MRNGVCYVGGSKKKKKMRRKTDYLKPIVESMRNPKILNTDFHIHTDVSADSNLNLAEAIDMVFLSGTPNVVGFANHETLSWITTNYIDGVSITPSVEITVSYMLENDYNEHWAHVLAVGFEPSDEGVIRGLIKLANARKDIVDALRYELRKYGVNIGKIDVAGKTSNMLIGDIARHIARTQAHKVLRMIKHIPYTFNRSGKRTLDIEGVASELFYVLRRKVNHVVGMARWPLEDLIQKVHNAGGKIIIAHPVLSHIKLEYEIFAQFSEMGVDAIEVLHPSMLGRPWDVKFMDELAQENSIGVTMGSDFHGNYDNNKNEYVNIIRSLKDLRAEAIG